MIISIRTPYPSSSLRPISLAHVSWVIMFGCNLTELKIIHGPYCHLCEGWGHIDALSAVRLYLCCCSWQNDSSKSRRHLQIYKTCTFFQWRIARNSLKHVTTGRGSAYLQIEYKTTGTFTTPIKVSTHRTLLSDRFLVRNPDRFTLTWVSM